MVTTVFHFIKGVFSFFFFIANTILWGTLIIMFCPFKLVFRWSPILKFINYLLVWFGENWIAFNNLGIHCTQNIKWTVLGLDRLNRDQSYFIISNHQSWVDIVVLQKIFYRKVPFLRFFIKRQLMFLPVLGQAWWALDFPAVRRYTRKFLEMHPERKGDDLKMIREMCSRYKKSPISVLNFLEGTRWTPRKHKDQQSPYQHLLKPKVGGFSLVLGAMGEQFHSLLDVTIVYPKNRPYFWHLLSGQIEEIYIQVNEIKAPLQLVRPQLEDWINELWAKKDLQISHILESLVLHPSVNV